MLRTSLRVVEIQYNKIVQNGIIWGAGAVEEVYTGTSFSCSSSGRRSSVRTDRSLVVGSVSCFLRQSPVESTCRLGGAGFRGGGGGDQVGHTCPVPLQIYSIWSSSEECITGFWGLSIV